MSILYPETQKLNFFHKSDVLGLISFGSAILVIITCFTSSGRCLLACNVNSIAGLVFLSWTYIRAFLSSFCPCKLDTNCCFCFVFINSFVCEGTSTCLFKKSFQVFWNIVNPCFNRDPRIVFSWFSGYTLFC